MLRTFLVCVGLLFAFHSWSEEPRKPGEVFRKILRKQGDDGVHTYRIPGQATTKDGTLIAVFDVRHKSAADLPGDIDVGMMRSVDDGETWSPMQVILDFDKNEKDARGNGVGDPAVLVDRKTGSIFVAALWSHGDRGDRGSGPGLTPDETGQLVLTRSDDDGRTWSKPVNISAKIAGRDPKWRLCFNGPGNGIQLKDGTLVFAAQYRDADKTYRSTFLYSKDAGATWAIAPAAIPTKPPTNEAQIAELSDGSLLLSMRVVTGGGKRAWARFTWKNDLSKGAWGEPWFEVPDPVCMASLIRHPSGRLFFSNPNSPKARVSMTVRTSDDEGKTWNAGQLLDPRPSAYSCLTTLKDGRIGILYECGEKHAYETLTFARLPK